MKEAISILKKLRAGGGRAEADDIQPASAVEQSNAATQAPDRDNREADPEVGVSDEKLGREDDIVPDPDTQRGVNRMEAATLAWTKTSLAAALVLYVLYLLGHWLDIANIPTSQQYLGPLPYQWLPALILSNLTPYITSSFQSHSLLTVINIVSSAMTAAVYIPMAKMLDVWGRAEGFLLMVGFSTLGLILMASAKTLASFCAAKVFYSVGFSGVIYTICVLAADATNLRNRGLAFAFTSSPYMITAFAGSKASEAFMENVGNWRWGFGSFAIILPVVTTPLFLLLSWNLRKAEKRGLVSRESSGRTVWQSVWYCIVQFDALGVFLFAGGLTVFLLPFTLATSAPHGWKTDYIIAMIVVGFATLVAFALYQIYLSPAPFLKHKFLTDRTVIAACLIDMTYQMSYYCWNSYFTSFLQVVNNLTIAEAGYVNSTFQVVSGVLLFIVGYLIRRTGRFRWLFFIAVPTYIFSLGLMIYFRRPNGHIGYIVMCEIFISMGGSVFILCMQLAVLAAVDHQHVAAALALLFVSGTIGGAVGNTISGTIWTNTFLPALVRYLPEEAASQAPTIYRDLVAQLSYPVGSPERLAIQKAYGYAQTRMLATGTAIMGLGFLWVFLMKDLNVKKMTQTRGVVF